ncbi:hypothetical protein ABIF93_006635 [Bradyrhizobium japonicum]
MKERNCVIVDAYSTGRYLPEQFKRYGIGTVHVMSAAQIPPIFQAHFDANLYDEVIRPSERMVRVSRDRERGFQGIVSRDFRRS